MKTKFIVEKIFFGLMIISVILVFAFLGSILITMIRNGWPAMSWDMITQLPGGGFYIGKEGGVLNAIVGSIYIVGASTILGLLISIPIVFFINIYLKNDSKLASITRLSFDVLYGRIYHHDIPRIADIVAGRYHRHYTAHYTDLCPLHGRSRPPVAQTFARSNLLTGSDPL